MAINRNSDASLALREAASLQLSQDVLPSSISSQIVPTFDITPRNNRYTNQIFLLTIGNETAHAVTTLPADRRFFVTGVSLSVVRDATATTTSVYCEVQPRGQGATALIYHAGITLTAGRSDISQSFPTPIELEPGSLIRMVSLTNVANFTGKGVLMGYFVENIKS